MQNLGDKLAQAGVRGASTVPPEKSALLREIQGLASKSTGKPITDPDRLKRLPPEFDSLRSITEGEDFVSTLAQLCRAHPSLISRDLIVVACELAHAIRDQLIADGKGGRQKRFTKTAISTLVSLKSDMPHGSAVIGFVLSRLR